MISSSKNIVKEIIGFILDREFLFKIKLTFWILVFYRFLSFLPIPGIDSEALIKAFFSGDSNNSVLGFIDRISGGALQRVSVMSLGIGPYIMCSLFFNFAHFFSTYFADLKKEGALGRQKINSYVKLCSFVAALVQGYWFALYCQNQNLTLSKGVFFLVQTSLLITCGSMIVVWFADEISSRGIGKGSSIIIYVNVVSGIPSFLRYLLRSLKSGDLSFLKLSVFLLIAMLLLFFVTFCERTYKTIKAQNLSHNRHMLLKSQMPEHLVYMKLNPAGILPPMLAGNWLVIPSWIDGFFHISRYELGSLLLASLTPGCIAYIIFHAVLIFFTSYVYAEIVFNPEETAKRFRNDTIIAGQMPGKSTQRFLEEKLFYVATLGGLYLVLVCCVPELFITKANQSLYISGTSYIIVVGVAVDLIDKISAGVYSRIIEKSMRSIRKGYFK